MEYEPQAGIFLAEQHELETPFKIVFFNGTYLILILNKTQND